MAMTLFLAAGLAYGDIVIPANCVKGEGTFSGTHSGTMSYYDFSSPTRKVVVFGLNTVEHPFEEFNNDGTFTAEFTELVCGATTTLNGRYEDCRVTGTWRAIECDGTEYGSGTFEIEGQAGGLSINLCGATGASGAAMLMAAVLSSKFTNRRRMVHKRLVA